MGEGDPLELWLACLEVSEQTLRVFFYPGRVNSCKIMISKLLS